MDKFIKTKQEEARNFPPTNTTFVKTYKFTLSQLDTLIEQTIKDTQEFIKNNH